MRKTTCGVAFTWQSLVWVASLQVIWLNKTASLSFSGCAPVSWTGLLNCNLAVKLVKLPFSLKSTLIKQTHMPPHPHVITFYCCLPLTHMLLKSSLYVSSPLPSDIRLSSLSISLASTYEDEESIKKSQRGCRDLEEKLITDGTELKNLNIVSDWITGCLVKVSK